MNECHRFRSLIAPYVDGVIPEPERVLWATHIAACSECHEEVQEYRRIIDDLRSLGPSDREVLSARDALSALLSKESSRPPWLTREALGSTRQVMMTQIAVAAGLLLCFRIAWTFLGGGLEIVGPGEFQPSVIWDRVMESLPLPTNSINLEFEIGQPPSWIGVGR